MDMQPHVFVVMPFGIKDVEEAKNGKGAARKKAARSVNFDEVYKLLIEPALKKASCIPFRADEEPGAGDIRTDMFFELVTADFVLADISILNANVFYELGVRHGVRSRGVFMIHGGWTKRPFDVAPDRTFDYEGEIFTVDEKDRDDEWRKRLDDQADQLAVKLRGAIEVDDRTIGSPVYKELVGLIESDWSNIQTAQAKYFGEVFAEWRRRVEVAKLNGRPGDILTLADDAPTRFHRTKLLWVAADALCNMQRFELAEVVLRDMIKLEPSNRDALTRIGLVLGRLQKFNEAKVHMLSVVEQFKHDPEAHGILGRVYKDLWRLEWKRGETLQERQQLAVVSSSYLASAIRSYDQAARRKFDYYTGINVVSFVKLLEFLTEETSDSAVDPEIRDIDDIVGVVRFAARNTLEVNKAIDAGPEGVWAAATLGELELVTGDGRRALRYYRDAAYAPATSYFSVNSMLEQLCTFESLGFRPEILEQVKKMLEERKAALHQGAGALASSSRQFSKIAVSSGHMIDKTGRAEERFPQRKVDIVRDRIAQQLKDWEIGAGDLAICGGACGSDILFAEVCVERGAEVWLFLPLPEGKFLEESVRLPDTDWERRFFALREKRSVKTFFQHERLMLPPKGASPFARNNLWMLNTARVEADESKNLYALLVWDEKPTGDGPGGTSDFAARAREMARHYKVVNPTMP